MDTMTTALAEALSDYERWREERAELSAVLGTWTGAEVWAESDDYGCDLAQRFAEALSNRDKLERDIATRIAYRFEGQGEAWSDKLSGDRLAAIAAEEAVRELLGGQ